MSVRQTGSKEEMSQETQSDDETASLDLDEKLRGEASHVLDVSGLGEILRREGYEPVGSYSLRTMTWRDLDFERTEEDPNWARHWEIGTRLARLIWVWKLNCTHAYRQPAGIEKGLYWGLRLSDPDGGPEWKVDLWTARAEEFERYSPNRVRWASLLTDQARVRILAIKKAVCGLPEYRRQILSVHIYEAVLDGDVCGIAEFMEWHRKRFHDLSGKPSKRILLHVCC